MQVLGVDPDLHNTALAFLDGESGQFTITNLAIVKVPIKIKGDEAVAMMASALCEHCYILDRTYDVFVDCAYIERPELHPSVGFKTQKAITALCHVAGSCATAASLIAREVKLITPAAWKGQVPKEIHQRKLLTRIGVPYIEKGKKLIPDWTSLGIAKLFSITESFHLIDAVGLAVKGLEIE